MHRGHLWADKHINRSSSDSTIITTTLSPESPPNSDDDYSNTEAVTSSLSQVSSSTDGALYLISARTKLLDYTLPQYRTAATSATAANRVETALGNLWLRTSFDYVLLGESANMDGKRRAVMTYRDARRVRGMQKGFRVNKRGDKDGLSGRVGACAMKVSAREAHERVMAGRRKMRFGGEGDWKWMSTSGVREAKRPLCRRIVDLGW